MLNIVPFHRINLHIIELTSLNEERKNAGFLLFLVFHSKLY